MRRLLVALAVLATVSLSVSAGVVATAPAVADAATHGTVVYGTVSDADGGGVEGAYVLVQPEGVPYIQRATNGSDPVVPALLEMVDDPPRTVKRNVTDGVGNYTVHRSRQGTYEVVAVTEDGRVSPIRTTTIEFMRSQQDLTVDAEQVQAVEGSDVAGTPGRTTTTTVTVANSDDEPMTNLSVRLSALPDGWTVEGVETGGTYREGDRTVRWQRVGAGETATATVTLSVPADAEMETHRVELSAAADSHFVEHTDAVRVRVSPANESKTPSATPTPLERDGVDVRVTATPTTASGGPASRQVPLVSVLVFSAGVGIAAYAVGRAGLPW